MRDIKGYLIEDGPGQYRVGARDRKPDPSYPYDGPCAEVSADKDFFHITTDSYEGHAMLNLEALPHLIKALRKLQVHLRNSTER